MKAEIKEEVGNFKDRRRTKVIEATAQELDVTEHIFPGSNNRNLSKNGWIRAAKGHDINR